MIQFFWKMGILFSSLFRFTYSVCSCALWGIHLLRSAQLSPLRRQLLSTITTGLLCGIMGVAFYSIIVLFTTLIFGGESVQGDHVWWLYLLIPSLGGLITGALVHFFFPDLIGSGVPQTKHAFERHQSHSPIHLPFTKMFMTTLSLGSGMSLGKEGPAIYVGAGLARAVGRFFGLPKQSIEALIPVGVAATLAAIFRAPLASVIFIVEEFIGRLNSPILGAAIIASVCAAVIADLLLPGFSHFDRSTGTYHFTTLGPSILIAFYGVFVLQGIFTGFLGAFLVRLFLRTRKLFRKMPKSSRWLQPACAGLFVGCIAVVFGHYQIMGPGNTWITHTLSGDLEAVTSWGGGFGLWGLLGSILSFFLLKSLVTAVAFGSGAVGGIFSPVVLLGALSGAFFGIIASIIAAFSLDISWDLLPNKANIIGIFALVGMGAALSSVIGNPISSVLMVFEMTHDFDLVLPLMLACAISYGIRRQYYKHGFYRAILLQDGIKSHMPLKIYTEIASKKDRVEDIMDAQSLSVFSYKTYIRDAERHLKEDTDHYPIISKKGKYIAIISKDDIKRWAKDNPQNRIYEFISQKSPPDTLFIDDDVSSALQKMGDNDMNSIAVVRQEDPDRLLGVLTLEMILGYYKINPNPSHHEKTSKNAQ